MNVVDGAADERRALEAVDRLRPVAEQAGLSMAELALAWVLRRPELASAIVGASRPEQVHANAKASGIELAPDTLAAIDEALGDVPVKGRRWRRWRAQESPTAEAQGWTDDVHALRLVSQPSEGRHSALVVRQLGVAHEELLELWRGGDERRKEPARRLADVLPGVRRGPRDEGERAGRRIDDLAADLDLERSFERVDQLVLAVVHVKGRSLPGAAMPSSAVTAPPLACAIALNVVTPPTGFSTDRPSPGANANGSVPCSDMLVNRDSTHRTRRR